METDFAGGGGTITGQARGGTGALRPVRAAGYFYSFSRLGFVWVACVPGQYFGVGVFFRYRPMPFVFFRFLVQFPFPRFAAL